ncbi:hypothetical protein BDV10DRAFT_153970 [Aspergillus recurvatus]
MVAARRVHLEPLLSSVLEIPNILGRLAQVKLREETSSVEPSLRRCLGHHGVLNKCVTATLESSPTQPHRNTTRPQSASRIDPKPAPRRTRRASEPHHIRGQILNIIKGLVHRRPSPEPLPGNDELMLVQARGAAESSSTGSRKTHAAPGILLGLSYFARLRQKNVEKSSS